MLAGCEQCVHRVQHLSIAAPEAFVLALVLLPGSDDEQLLEPIGIL